MSGDSTSQTNLNKGMSPSLAKEIENHRQNLEEIRKKLHPSELIEVLATTVEKTFIPSIVSLFKFIEKVEKAPTADLLTYITDPDLLKGKLNEIILVFYDALEAEKMSKREDDVEKKLKAGSFYRRYLSTCYGLLEQALGFFKPIEQTQQRGTNTVGNTKSIRKTS